MLKKWINKKYLNEKKIKNINKIFLKAKPYPNFVLNDFFNKKRLSSLKKEILKEKFEKVEKDLFSLSHTCDLISSDNIMIKEFYSLLFSKEFISLMEKLTNEKLSQKIDMSEIERRHTLAIGYKTSRRFPSMLKNTPNNLVRSVFDMQSHGMAQGDYLLFHDDVVEGRSIAYIVYLADLSAEDGGALRLYDIKKPLNPIKKINPGFNTFACFKVSSKSMHDVEEVKSNKQRLTIGGWFYGN